MDFQKHITADGSMITYCTHKGEDIVKKQKDGVTLITRWNGGDWMTENEFNIKYG